MTNEQIRAFLISGRAVFTLESKKTDKHYTFKAKKATGSNILWLYVLNDGDKYVYLGTVSIRDRLVYRETRKSRPSKLHYIMRWFFTLLSNDDENKDLVFRHSGSCGRCGRILTTPESIDSGLGPICRNK